MKTTANTNTEVKKQIDALVFSRVKKRRKIVEKSCQYLSHFPERFCDATTHDNCVNCKFYEPTHQERLRLILSALEDYEKDNEDLKDMVEYYRTCGTGTRYSWLKNL